MAPASVLNATMRTRTTLVLDDAQADCPEAYSTDLQQRQVRSVLCLPLLKQGLLIGLVYLENSLVPKLFNAQRLTMLEILASQAAVSLQTAKLYEQLVEDNRLHAQMEADLRSSRAELARSSHLKVMGELSASIAHEISQPLLGIVSNASASLRWLKRDQPDLEEAIQGLEDIRSDSARAADIVQALRVLAKQAPLQRLPVQIDSLIAEVVRLSATDLAKPQSAPGNPARCAMPGAGGRGADPAGGVQPDYQCAGGHRRSRVVRWTHHHRLCCKGRTCPGLLPGQRTRN